MVAYIFNLRPWEAQAGQPDLHNATPSQKRENNKTPHLFTT